MVGHWAPCLQLQGKLYPLLKRLAARVVLLPCLAPSSPCPIPGGAGTSTEMPATPMLCHPIALMRTRARKLASQQVTKVGKGWGVPLKIPGHRADNAHEKKYYRE